MKAVYFSLPLLFQSSTLCYLHKCVSWPKFFIRMCISRWAFLFIILSRWLFFCDTVNFSWWWISRYETISIEILKYAYVHVILIYILSFGVIPRCGSLSGIEPKLTELSLWISTLISSWLRSFLLIIIVKYNANICNMHIAQHWMVMQYRFILMFLS